MKQNGRRGGAGGGAAAMTQKQQRAEIKAVADILGQPIPLEYRFWEQPPPPTKQRKLVSAAPTRSTVKVINTTARPGKAYHQRPDLYGGTTLAFGGLSRDREPLKQLSQVNLSNSTSSSSSSIGEPLQMVGKDTTTTLIVRTRADYPRPPFGFNPTLKKIYVNGLYLKKIDSNLLKLKELTFLDLSNNIIETIEALVRLGSRLRILNLADNKITAISEDFFCAESMKGLESLSLARNGLNEVPRSIVKLNKLRTLTLTGNNLKSLPYNIHFIENLSILHVNGNQLEYLPHPLTLLRLHRLDICNNVDLLPKQQERVQVALKKEFPTLLELAAGFIATHNYKHRGQPGKGKVLPKPIETARLKPNERELIEKCMQCKICGNLTCRYTLRNTISQINPATTSLITTQEYRFSTSDLPTKTVFCEPACFNRRGGVSSV